MMRIGDAGPVFMAVERDLNGVVLGGRYRVTAQIGGGGMGTVHAGEHLEVGRKVAIKILLPEAVARPALVERFRREARLTARIEHEHVVECLDVGVSEAGECFYVMEWLRGEDLQALLRRERTLAWPRARAIVAQVCRALAAAHDRGVVHRDLKPGNIFLVQREDNPDFVKVLDFGIAKLVAPDEAPAEALTRTGEVVGTTPYMAPELAAGEPFDHRIDVYAVGVILFQLLCGRLPYRGRTPRQVLAEILQGDPPRLAEMSPGLIVSPALEALLGKALHRDAGQRFADMAALHEALLALPEDACRSGEADETRSDPSASEVAMAASMIGPMLAGSRDPGSDSGRMAATADTRIEPDEPRTPIDPPRSAAPRRRRGLALVGAAVLLGVAGLAGWFVWPRGELLAVEQVVGVAAPVDEVAGAARVDEVAGAAPGDEVSGAAPVPGTSEREGPPADDRSAEAVADPLQVEAEATATADAKQRPRGEARSGFDDVMRRAATRVRRCLGQGGVKAGTRVRFDIVVEARTGRITAATPRPPFGEQARLGACVVDSTRGSTVRPPPVNEWRRSHEFAG
ncbi:MAG: serine/threonine protein kinase [Nannocystis sp.]|nr:serine/threonine protein kinase [Nannocystis sp.]